jgi:hypothetical protein
MTKHSKSLEKAKSATANSTATKEAKPATTSATATKQAKPATTSATATTAKKKRTSEQPGEGQAPTPAGRFTIGLDLGDRSTAFCVLDSDGASICNCSNPFVIVVPRCKPTSRPSALARHLSQRGPNASTRCAVWWNPWARGYPSAAPRVFASASVQTSRRNLRPLCDR